MGIIMSRKNTSDTTAFRKELGEWMSVVTLLICFALPVSHAARIKDMTSVEGVRNNQLIGYGLVVGLDGTGDQTTQTPFTTQTLYNLMTQLGIVVPADVIPQLKNVAAVMVQAELPSFAKPGQTIDVTVSSIGNAKSLRGGSLVMTQLKGADGQVYVIAQGNLVVGGFGASGGDGTTVTVNVPSAGRIPNGGTVERLVANPFSLSNSLTLNLNRPDFTTAQRLADRINEYMDQKVAVALDSISVQVMSPKEPGRKVAYLAELENLNFIPGEEAAKVIINSRTGTLVIGNSVRVLPAAVAHGNLTVSISETNNISQPSPFSRSGETVVVPESEVTITEETNPMFLFQSGVSLDELVRAVNEVGASPADLVSILEALEQVGALQARLVII
jgi:flagellar P-ring protein FlgI